MCWLGEQIEKARESKGLGLQSMCEFLTVAPSSYLKWKDGVGNPTINTLARIFEKLDLNWQDAGPR